MLASKLEQRCAAVGSAARHRFHNGVDAPGDHLGGALEQLGRAVVVVERVVVVELIACFLWSWTPEMSVRVRRPRLGHAGDGR